MVIVRTKTQGCYETRTNLLGTYLIKSKDSSSSLLVDDSIINNFVVSSSAPRIPSHIWSAIINLYTHFYIKGQEVCVILLYNPNTKEWKTIVPKQIVDQTSITKEALVGCNLLTGEEELDYMNNLEGYEYMGDSHLHPFILPMFSKTDDDNELNLPGLHILVSSVDNSANRFNYTITPSIVAGKKRFIIKDEQLLIDTTPTNESFHPNCLNYVKINERSLFPSTPISIVKWKNYGFDTSLEMTSLLQTIYSPMSSLKDYWDGSEQDWWKYTQELEDIETDLLPETHLNITLQELSLCLEELFMFFDRKEIECLLAKIIEEAYDD